MLTFDCEAVCCVSAVYEEAFSGTLDIGGAGLFTAVLVQSGAAAAGSAAAGSGGLLLAAGPVRLCAQGACGIAGASLSGYAPEAAARGISQPLALPATASMKAGDVLGRIVRGYGSRSPCEGSALGYALLCALPAAGAEGGRAVALADAAAAHMEEHYAEVYGVEELAADLGVSKGHLIRVFSAAKGLSPGRYLTAVRVNAAKRLLLRENYPLDVVAGLCGFAGANYLCKVFRAATGQPPAAWRRGALAAAGSARGTRPSAAEEELYL